MRWDRRVLKTQMADQKLEYLLFHFYLSVF